MATFKAAFALVAIAIFANSQTTYVIDPNSVPLATREGWCTAQKSSCPLLCLQNANESDTGTTSNDCFPDTLEWDCICSNGLTPNEMNFSQTIPFFECQEYGDQCVTACDGDSTCATACRVNNPCGAQNPTRINSTTSSTMPATATGGGSSSSPTVFNGLGGSGSSTSSTKKSGSQAALEIGRSYGLAIVFTGLFAGFALMM